MRTETRSLLDRWRCWIGRHTGAVVKTLGPYPYPDAYNCSDCGRLLYMIDEHVTYTINGQCWTGGKGGIRYANLDQWLEERT